MAGDLSTTRLRGFKLVTYHGCRSFTEVKKGGGGDLFDKGVAQDMVQVVETGNAGLLKSRYI